MSEKTLTSHGFLSSGEIAPVRRDGFVICTSRYTHVVYEPDAVKQGLDLNHYIWRIHRPLPKPKELLSGNPSPTADKPFLAGYLIAKEYADDKSKTQKRPLKMTDFKSVEKGREIKFVVHLSDLDIRRGETVTYDITWGYPGAFWGLQELGLEQFEYHSVGIRPGDRGPIKGIVSIHFETIPDQFDPPALFTEPPRIQIARTNRSAGETPMGFWSNDLHWGKPHLMEYDVDASQGYMDVYTYEEDFLYGQMRAIWKPSPEYSTSIPAEETEAERPSHRTRTD